MFKAVDVRERIVDSYHTLSRTAIQRVYEIIFFKQRKDRGREQHSSVFVLSSCFISSYVSCNGAGAAFSGWFCGLSLLPFPQ